MEQSNVSFATVTASRALLEVVGFPMLADHLTDKQAVVMADAIWPGGLPEFMLALAGELESRKHGQGQPPSPRCPDCGHHHGPVGAA